MDPDPSLEFLQISDTTIVVGLIVMLILLSFSAFVSAAEVALFSLTPTDIDEACHKDQRKGTIISNLLQKPKKLLATILVTNTFMNIAVVVIFSSLGSSLFAQIESPSVKFTVEVVVLTFIILLFGEVLPKIYANRNTVRFSLFAAGPLSFLDKLLSPISLPMRSVTIYLNDKLGKQQKSVFSVDKLSQALELTSPDGTSDDEQKILAGIVSFGNTDTRQVMSPRIDIFALEIDETFSEILPKITERGFSRIPVYRDSIDKIEGVLFV
ncbi:MAG TPA: CNNM domain-containing protein, partial [Flavobacterium sp.]